MLEPLDDTFAEHATRLRRIAVIAAMASPWSLQHLG